MDAFFPILAALLFCIVFSIIRFFKNKHPNLPPSPPCSLPLLGHLHLVKPPLHRSFASLSIQHGPLLSLHFGSRPVVLVASSSLADICLSKSDVVFANRPRLLAGKLLGYNYSGIGFTSYGPHLCNLRRLATVEVLSSHRMQSLSHVRANEVRCLLKSLFRAWKAGKSIAEFRPRLSELTFNTMMGMIAGKRYYGEAEEAESEEAKLFRWIMTEFGHLAGVSYLGDFFPLLGWLDGGVAKRMKRLGLKMDEFFQRLIDEQRQKNQKNDEDGLEMSKTKTLMELLLELQKNDEEYYKDDMVKAFVGALMMAGTDTSSLTIEWAMALLLNHPDVLKKAKAELDVHLANDHLLEESDLSILPYLRCIVNETLRLYPIAPLLLPHQSSEETTVGGFTVPAGTMVLINAWAIHRDPEVWAEPEEFKPERFEAMEEETVLGCKFMPFGHGRRACPGAGLGMKVVAMGLGSLIQCFDWERVGEGEVDMSEGHGLTMPKAKPLEASYKPCEKMIGILSQL